MFNFRRRPRGRGKLAEFYDSQVPKLSAGLSDLPLLAVDMETTGLDARRHRIVSIGWVPINGREIDLSHAGYVLVKGAEVGESATIHRLTDDMVASGVDEVEAVGQLLDALQGRVMVNHFSRLEVTFLDSACRRHYGGPFESTVVDTFAIERRHMERMGTYPRGEDLRLARVRNRYQLPNYRNHNALTDALACAELYLAQVARTKALTVKSLQY